MKGRYEKVAEGKVRGEKISFRIGEPCVYL